MPGVVLVTGISRFPGGRVAARLAADPNVTRVIGVDTEPPGGDLRRRLGRAEFVRADIRNPLIAKVITDARVDTVVHASLSAPGSARGRPASREINILGTMQLLAACQAAPLVHKLVVKSSDTVYGSSARDPVVFTEDMSARSRLSGYPKDVVEVESYVRGFARRRPDVVTTTLRFANIIGPQVDSVLTRYFSLPVAPTVFGHDARLQLLHPTDAVDVLERAVRVDAPGVFNVGADGVLMLSQAIRRAGRMPVAVPGPLVPVVAGFFHGTGLIDFSPELMRFLNFGRVADTTRLRTVLDFHPKWGTAAAFDEYVHDRGLTPVPSQTTVDRVERWLLDLARRTGRT